MDVLTNVEFVLLQLIGEREYISGYEINKLVEERGYREWADVGTTSIYVRLEKLNKRKLVRSSFDTKKKGKGPPPKKFALKESGKEALRQNVIDALANSRERDKRFDLGLAGLPFIETREAVEALEKRNTFLNKAVDHIKGKLVASGGENLPFHVKVLFQHPLFLLKQELTFTATLIEGLQNLSREEKAEPPLPPGSNTDNADNADNTDNTDNTDSKKQ
ncbi:MAG: PadR family transcriptional regulator [bacterium]|nr:PadR family transcriptional regulator [bacterium]